MPLNDEILSDQDVGVSWGSNRARGSDLLTDEDVGLSWKPRSIPDQLPEDPEDVPDVGRPRNLSDKEWAKLRKAAELRGEAADAAIAGEMLAGGERAIGRVVEPTIPPELIEAGLSLGVPAINSVPGIRKSVSETAAGLTSPVNLTMAALGGGASLIPRVGGAVARGIAGGFAADIAQHIPEQAAEAGRLSVEGTPEQKQKALADLGLSVLMATAAGTHAVRPGAVPPDTFPPAPDPDLVARNVAAPGTVRAQEIQSMGLPEAEAPPMFEAGDVPFDRMRRFGGMEFPPVEVLPRLGRIEDVPILEEVRPKEELETRGKVSFGAEAPTLLRSAPELPPEVQAAIDNAEQIGLTRSAEAAARAVEKGQRAVQEPTANEGVLRQERSKVELPQVGTRDTEGNLAQAKGRAEAPQAEVSLGPDAADVDRYNDLQARMTKAIEEQGFESPEFQELWKTSEALKNKYGGHVPTAELIEKAKTNAPKTEPTQPAGGIPPVPAEKPLTPTKAAKKFRDLIKEYGVQLGYIVNPDKIGDAGLDTKTGHGTGSIKAKVARAKEFQAATQRAAKELGGDATKQDSAQLAELLPKLQERIAQWEKEQAAAPPVEVPKLAPGEQGTGEMFKGPDQPFNLAGEKGLDTGRIEAEKAAAEQSAKEAADLAAKQQLELPADSEAWKNKVAMGNDISIQEFEQHAKEGKVHKATGAKPVNNDGTGKTAMSLGHQSGYSFNDLTRFYLERRSGDTLQAFDDFAADAAKEMAALERPDQPAPGNAPQKSNLGKEPPSKLDLSPEEEAQLGAWAERAKAIADKLREQFKTPDTGKELGTFGAVPKVINAAVELAAKVIERGGSLADAIGEAIEYVRKNHTGIFDEAGFRKFMEKEHGKAVPPAPPGGRPPTSGTPPVPPTPPAPVPPGPAPAPAPAPGIIQTIRNKIRNVRDYITVDPIPKLTREMGEASQSAFEHAKARGAVPMMINNMLAKVFPEQFHDAKAMARTMDILKKDDILGGYDEFLQRASEADAAGDTRAANKWRKMAASVGSVHDIALLEREVNAARSDPTISGNIERWKEIVNPELDALYNENKGMDPNTPREGRGRVFGARTNLLRLEDEARWQNALTGDEASPVPQQSASNYRNPNAKRDKFDRIAKFTGEYSDNPAAILANVLFHRWNEVTKVRFYNDLVRTENASWEMPADGMIKGEKASRLAVKVPETNTTMTPEGIAVDSPTRQVEKSLWVPESLVEEIRGVLATDLNLKAHPVGKVLNKLQIYQMADFVAHTKNQISSVANSPSGKILIAELARRFPGLNVADAVARIGKAAFDVTKDSADIRAELDWMGRRGLLREKSLYHEEGFWNKPLKVTHDFLYRNDVAMRVVMNRFYNTLVENGLAPDSMVQRRRFVSQAGEYNSRLLGPMMRAARSSGLAPFVVAGRNFNRFGVRRITGHPGFKPTNLAASAKLRGLNVYTVAGTVAIPMIFNYLTQGKITGRPGTPLGAFDLGGEKDENGNHRILDWAQLQGIRRGARITGIDALAEGIVSGRDADEILGKMRNESLQALSHPWVGPSVGFVARAGFGKNIDLRAGPQPEEARNMGSPNSIKQGMENLRVAVKNQNRPLYGLAVRPLVGDQDKGYWKDLLGDLGRSPMSAGGLRKAVSPALEEARSLSITGTAVSPESAEKMKLKRKLMKEMKAGNDAPVQEARDKGQLSKRDVTEMENKTTTAPLNYLVHQHLSTKQAMRVWHLATTDERKELLRIVGDKINRDQKSSEEDLDKWTKELEAFEESQKR